METSTPTGKAWYRSKTLWISLLTTIAGIGELLVGWFDEAGIPSGGVVVFVGALGAALRFATGEPVRVRKPAVAEGQEEGSTS